LSGFIKALHFIPLFLLAAIVHECAHGLAALWCGDQTAQRSGRLTLNPIPHIDPIMSVLVPLVLYIITGGRFIFGGARPVPVNFSALRNPEWQVPFVSIAGALSNVILGVLSALLWVTLVYFMPESAVLQPLTEMCMLFTLINFFLAGFNMIPIPPLDGSKVFFPLIPERIRPQFYSLERYGIILLLVFIHTPFADKYFIFINRSVVSIYLFLQEIVL